MRILTTQDFAAEALEGELPVLIDFWADWCVPCTMLAPIIEEIARERSDIKICKVNVDNDREIAVRYGVRSIPTLLFFNRGEVAETLNGTMSKDDLNKAINKFLKGLKGNQKRV